MESFSSFFSFSHSQAIIEETFLCSRNDIPLKLLANRFTLSSHVNFLGPVFQAQLLSLVLLYSQNLSKSLE